MFLLFLRRIYSIFMFCFISSMKMDSSSKDYLLFDVVWFILFHIFNWIISSTLAIFFSKSITFGYTPNYGFWWLCALSWFHFRPVYFTSWLSFIDIHFFLICILFVVIVINLLYCLFILIFFFAYYDNFTIQYFISYILSLCFIILTPGRRLKEGADVVVWVLLIVLLNSTALLNLLCLNYWLLIIN